MRSPEFSKSGRNLRFVLAWFSFALSLILAAPGQSAPVSAETAGRAVQGWLRQDRQPFGKMLSPNIKQTKAVKNSAGEVLYYVVPLKPAGYVILSADDLAEPILAFSATGTFDPPPGSTWATLLNGDSTRRAGRLKAHRAFPTASSMKARNKWNAFLAGSPNPPPDVEENGNIVIPSQIRVAPLVQTLWSQTVDVSLNDACYNYYTPQGTNLNTTGSISNYPCGCVATALAQEMYYFHYPTVGVGAAHLFVITNNTLPQTEALLGGNLGGGPYQWANMPLSPNNPTDTQAKAIGALTHDAGLAVNMSYTPSLSSAYTYLAQKALTNTFKFSNAAYFENDTGLSGTNLINILNPNLDAGLPVILGIEPAGGHCLLVDGYGYSAGTLFHHLNTGFGGDDDIWYALPQVDTSDDNGDFTTVVACVYNIYTNGAGQIISGRVTDPTGAAVAGVTIAAVQSGGGAYGAATDSNGVYALARLPAAASYTLTATKAGSSSATNTFATGTSVYNVLPSGNVWGADFVLIPEMLITPPSGFTSVGRMGGPFTVTGQLYTLSNSTTASISWDLTNTTDLVIVPNHGTIAPGTASNIVISLTPGVTNHSPGTTFDYVLITNLNNGTVVQLNFPITITAGNYPIALAGFNRDVVVEAAAVGGVTFNYADSFDPLYPSLEPPGPLCFYEQGLTGINLVGGGAISAGLPAGGKFQSAVSQTIFQLAPYAGSNVLYLTQSAPASALSLAAPASYQSFTVLAASAQGSGNGSLAVHFSDGTASSNIAFNAADYLSAGGSAALSQFGLLAAAGLNEFSSIDDNSSYPSLYETSIDLHAMGLDTKPIASITFTAPALNGSQFTTNSATGIFAVSGSLAAYSGNYPVTVSASPSGAGTLNGGGNFTLGYTNTVTASPNPGHTFANWTQGGVVVSTSPTYTFLVNGGETLVANFLSQAYSLIVDVSPSDGGTVTGGGVFMSGDSAQLTATANSGFEFVGWSGDASGAQNPLSITVNSDLHATAQFAAIGSGLTLTVLTAGDGTVTPDLNGKPVKTNHIYTLTATPKAGNVFSNWTGSITTNKNPLTFKLSASMVLQANFITNPFLSVKGTYNGLFFASNGVTEQTAGMLKGFAVGTKGIYSGVLWINGVGHAFGGSFGLDGHATHTIARAAAQGGPTVLALTVANSTNPAPYVTGTVTGSNWSSVLTADIATNTFPSGEYTMLIPPDATNMPPNGAPGGDGYALITNHLGLAKITGALADGTPLSQSVPVSKDGYIPIYATLYGNKGLLLGWINLTSTNAPGTILTWIRPAGRSSAPYGGGFTNRIAGGAIALSLWTNGSTATSLLTNIYLLDTINDSNVLAVLPVGITGGKILGSGVAGTLNPKTGLFKVTIGAGANKTNGVGAILQNAASGGGYFLTRTNAQAIKLGP